MKAYSLLHLAAGAALLPGLTFAANSAKAVRKHAARPPSAIVETLKLYDKNANHQIDAEELPLLQKAYLAMRNIDKDADGQLEQAEADGLKRGTASGKRTHLHGQMRKSDKNGNRKIDADEIAGLQKVLEGSPTLSRLDRNKNGKLEDSEIERVNKRLEHGGKRKGKSSKQSTAPENAPSAPSKPTTPAGTKENTENTDKIDGKWNEADPFLPPSKPGESADN